MVHQPVSRGLAVFADASYNSGLTGNGSALEVLHDDALYKSTTLLYFTLLISAVWWGQSAIKR